MITSAELTSRVWLREGEIKKCFEKRLDEKNSGETSRCFTRKVMAPRAVLLWNMKDED